MLVMILLSLKFCLQNCSRDCFYQDLVVGVYEALWSGVYVDLKLNANKMLACVIDLSIIMTSESVYIHYLFLFGKGI